MNDSDFCESQAKRNYCLFFHVTIYEKKFRKLK